MTTPCTAHTALATAQLQRPVHQTTCSCAPQPPREEANQRAFGELVTRAQDALSELDDLALRHDRPVHPHTIERLEAAHTELRRIVSSVRSAV